MQAWDDYLLSLEKTYGRETTDKWLRTLTLLRFDACNLYLEASDALHASWIEEHILPHAKKQLRNNNGHEIKIHLAIHGEKNRSPHKPAESDSNQSPLSFASDILDPIHTYEQFVPGAKNRIPFQVLCKLTGFNPHNGRFEDKPQEMYNPIYIYGPSGTGKTHLLMAAAAAFEIRGAKVFYVKAETFTEHVVKAIRSGQMQKFRNTYRHIDALIVDDIQVFSRKTATQEELFHTFNTLHTAGKQIILSSNVNPRQLEGIEERLVSRFEWGITLPLVKVLEPLELLQIVKSRSQYYDMALKKEVIDFMLSSFQSPIAICKALDHIAIKMRLDKIPSGEIATLEFLLPTLKKLIDEEKEHSLTPQKILELVADIFGIKVEDILSKSQSREVVLPRQICMYLLRKELKMPYIKIGGVFSRDHSTVMSSIRQITRSIESQDKDVFYYLNDIQRKLANAS